MTYTYQTCLEVDTELKNVSVWYILWLFFIFYQPPL